jgi:hypothetical protein
MVTFDKQMQLSPMMTFSLFLFILLSIDFMGRCFAGAGSLGAIGEPAFQIEVDPAKLARQSSGYLNYLLLLDGVGGSAPSEQKEYRNVEFWLRHRKQPT